MKVIWIYWLFLNKVISNYLKKCEMNVAKKYEKIKSCVEVNPQEDRSETFYINLAPKDDTDKDGVYKHALEWALKDDKVLNVALTGSYGSGKSSILTTFIRQHFGYHYLNISLASFQNDVSQDIDNNLIEKSILQQIFYKVKAGKIPYSRFRRISNHKLINILSWIFILVFEGISGVLLFFPTIITGINKNIFFLKTQFSALYVNILIVTFTITFLLIVVKIARYFFKNVKISTIKIENVEFNTGNNESVFNKYLDEILYFFETTKFDIIIIEDLDRFENIDIFIKLRELNKLINNSDQILRKVVFVYAIKDDMFCTKDRTKFFDFIIPVIPVINSSNSNEILMKKIKEANLEESLSESFINDITIYIDDMRLLNNIFNEFLLYKENLKGVGLNSQNLFAMVVYKNNYPEDFAKLQFDEGIAHNAFMKKTTIISEEIQKRRKRYIELEERLKKANQEHLNSLRELKVAFLDLASGGQYVHQFQVDGANYISLDFLNGSHDFSIMKNSSNIRCYCNGSWTPPRAVVTIISGSPLSFFERQEIMELKNGSSLEEIREEMNELKLQEHDIKSWSLKRTINEVGNELFFDQNWKNTNNRLLIFLLRHGYINEMYHSYISYFYPGSLTQEDMNYVMSVKDQECLNFGYELTNVKKIISRLNDNEFKGLEILNYNLVEFLIENQPLYKEHLSSVMEVLSNESLKSLDFIDSYMEETKYREIFISNLCEKWENICNFILVKSNYSILHKDYYLINIINYVPLENILIINKQLILTKYISAKSDFIKLAQSLGQEHIQKIVEILKVLEIKFQNVDEELTASELYEYICQNSMYEININMINQVAHIKAGCDLEQLLELNLTCIKNSNYHPLINYIDQNIEVYVTEVFLKIPENRFDTEDTLIDLLDNDDVSIDTKNQIIHRVSICFSDITAIEEEYWSNLIREFKVIATWSNIIYYYELVNIIDDNIISFISNNDNYLILSASKINENDIFEEQLYRRLSDDIIKCEKITTSIFTKLSQSLPFKYDIMDMENISNERVRDIIQSDLLNFTDDIYTNVLKFHRDNLVFLIEKNIDSFLKMKKEIDKIDIYNILKSNEIKPEQKIRVISQMKEDWICDNDAKLASLICIVMLENNKDNSIKKPLLRSLFKNLISRDLKIRLLNAQMKFMDHTDISECLVAIGEPYSEISIKMKMPVIDKKPHDIELLNQLLLMKYISSYKEEKNRLRVYTKHK